MALPQPIIIVSTGRTGTVFFAGLLADLFPNIEAFHERGFSHSLNILSNLYYSKLIPKSVLTTAWKAFKSRELNECQKPYIVEANTFLYGVVATAPELYPGLRVVHLVRDPRSYVRSHINWNAHRARSYVASRFVPFWRPNPFLVGQMPLAQAVRLSEFERYCWIWDFKNRAIQQLEKSSVPYLRLRFEDFFGGPAPEQQFNCMLEFMGLPPVSGVEARFRKPANEAKGDSFPAWQNWSPGMCARLVELCGPLMSAYGYGNEPVWIEKVQAGKTAG
ncbi:MAG: hypothetical protein ACKOC5_03885 [Chloroflexota bacterium]